MASASLVHLGRLHKHQKPRKPLIFKGFPGLFLYQSRKGLRPSMSITVFLFPVPVQLTFRLIFCIIRRNKARWAKVFAHSIAQLVKRHWGSEMLSLAAQIHEYKGG